MLATSARVHDRRVSDPPRDGRGRRPARAARVRDRGPRGHGRARGPRADRERDPQLRVRVPAAPDHRQPRPRRRSQGGPGSRPAARLRGPRRERPAARRAARGGRARRRAGPRRRPETHPRHAGGRPGGPRRRACRLLVLAPERSREAGLVDGLEVAAVGSLRSAVRLLRGGPADEPPPAARPASGPRSPPARTGPDLGDVRGQRLAVRALMIAAAGSHNLLLSGAPGHGQDDARAATAIDPPATRAARKRSR